MKIDLRKIKPFVLWILVCTMIVACNPITRTTPPADITATPTPIATPKLEEWQSILSVATETQPILQNNPTSEWAHTQLAENISFSSRLQVKLEMITSGVNGIMLTATKLGDPALGEPWWKGHKRLEILYESGFLNVILRDGSKQEPVYLSHVQLEPGNNEVIVMLDSQAKNIEIQNAGRKVMQIPTSSVGDFPNGLFPEGQILTVESIHGPNSGCELTELEFLVPLSNDGIPSP